MKFASFNVQKFGKRKLTNRLVRETPIKVVSRYDIIVILEVVDLSARAVEMFLRELNLEKVVDWVGYYQYEDNQPGDKDAFAREPYVLRFRCHTTVLEDLVLIPVHTNPKDAVKELDELYVYSCQEEMED